MASKAFCGHHIAALMVVLGTFFALGVHKTSAATAGVRRQVDCTGTSKVVASGGVSLYSVGLVNDTVNFDTLLVFSGASGGGADFGEALNTINRVKGTINGNASWTTNDIGVFWNSTWTTLASIVETEGMTYLNDHDNISAASALHRASQYYQLAGRFVGLKEPSNLAVYRRSVELFELAIGLTTTSPRFAACTPQQISFQGSWMHGYWCPSPYARPDGKRPTIVTVNGYDGTAEIQYYTIARSMVERGYNVLIFEGPGQGYTARFNNLTFMPNFEVAVSAALDFVLQNFAVDAELMFLWGESFGGYLAPRAFAYEPRFRGLVTNGGVYDFYQVMVCDLPDNLRALYYDNETVLFNTYIDQYLPHSTGLSFALSFGSLGFGVTSYSELLDALSAYTMAGSMELFTNRSLFVYDPAWDTLTGNQSQIFYAQLPPSANAALVQLDPYRGTGMHCAVGSTENVNIAIARWLEGVLGQ